MTTTSDSPKARTVALPHFNRGLMQARQIQSKVRGLSGGESSWNGMVFGPYLVPLSRRAE